MERINEKTTCYVTANFYDKDGVLEAPSTITYTVHDVDTGTEIVASTAVAAASSVEITLDGDTVNAIVTAGRRVEKRRVTIVGAYSGSDSVKDDYIYEVVNLVNVS